MPRPLLSRLVLCVLCSLTLGCASHKPILYPNTHFQQVGKDQAEREIGECMDLAEAAGAKPSQGKTGDVATNTAVGGAVGAASGAVGGAILGHPGSGAAVGAASGATAGFLRGLFRSPKPSPAYTQFVNRCLKERGFDPVGWE